MPTPLDILIGVVLPATLCGLLLLLARRVAWGPGAGAALAVGAGCVAGHLLQRGWRGFPPAEATDWAWICAAGGALLGAAGLTRRGPALLRAGLRLLAAGAAAWLVLASWRRGAEPGDVRATLGLIGGAVAVAWAACEARQPAPAWLPAAILALTAAGAATAIGMSGSAKIALLAGAVCGVLVATCVASALRLAPPALDGAPAPAVLALAALVVAARFYSELPASSALLLAAAPCVTLLPRALLAERARGAALTAGLALACVALLGLAVKLAVDASPSWEGLGY